MVSRILLQILGLHAIYSSRINSDSKSRNQKILTFDIQPTTQLLLNNKAKDSQHGRRLNILTTTLLNTNNSAVYSSLQLASDILNNEKKEINEELLLNKFNQLRNISRFERSEQDFLSTRNNTEKGRRRLQPYSFQNSPLLQGFGTHYVTAWVGTPPQRKSVIVDTGSHYTAFPCTGCHKCGEEYHTDKYFAPEKSSTFRALACGECVGAQCSSSTGRCEFSQSYTEGSSWQAYQVIDRFFVGNNKNEGRDDPVDNSFAVEFMFGCQTSEQGLFVTQLADGIMGMSAHEATFPKQLYNAKKVPVNQFSLCFAWELSVSKEGVNSGILTLGGIDTRLHSSPMVYVKNMVLSGWYTVYVKNIFLRKGGGISAASAPGAKIIKLPIDVHEVNSGKGVIVDSGTTDTYLSKSLEKSFLEAWKSITGMKYSNSAVRLTTEEVKYLPTLLIQLTAFQEGGNSDEDKSSSNSNAGNGVGLAGDLDPKNPKDVIIAVPPTHYMEYTPNRDTYTSRLYFTESRGGVIGANAMQGHDVLFDWENGRVGFAESSCNYAELVAPLVKSSASSESSTSETDKSGVNVVDCTLSNVAVSSSCADSIDATKCSASADSSTTFDGVEKLVWVIEKEALNNGKTCEDVAKNMLVASYDVKTKDNLSVTCTEKGMCYTVQPCKVTCAKILESSKKSQSAAISSKEQDIQTKKSCGDSSWGACTSSCVQSKITSYLADDGKCVEQKPKQSLGSEKKPYLSTRPCHIQACLQTNPCRVPFLVHAIFGLGGINPEYWTQNVQDSFIEALSELIGAKGSDSNLLFGPGDVNILMRNPWTPDLSGNKSIGVKLIVEISIFNPKTVGIVVDTKQDDIKTLRQGTEQLSCNEEELYIYARAALDVHTALQRETFLNSLFYKANEMLQIYQDSESKDKDYLFNDDNVKISKVLTSWTIKTEVGGRGIVHDHSNDDALRKTWMQKFSAYYHRWKQIFIVVVLFCIIILFSLFGVVHYRRNSKNDAYKFTILDNILSTREIHAAASSASNPSGKGTRYSRVPTNEGLKYSRNGRSFML